MAVARSSLRRSSARRCRCAARAAARNMRGESPRAGARSDAAARSVACRTRKARPPARTTRCTRVPTASAPASALRVFLVGDHSVQWKLGAGCFRLWGELCYGPPQTTRHFRMCTLVRRRASWHRPRRIAISGGILACLSPLLVTAADAQACADSISNPSIESVERLLQVADCQRADGQLERARVLLESAAGRESSGAEDAVAIQGRLGRLSMARGDYALA